MALSPLTAFRGAKKLVGGLRRRKKENTAPSFSDVNLDTSAPRGRVSGLSIRPPSSAKTMTTTSRGVIPKRTERVNQSLANQTMKPLEGRIATPRSTQKQSAGPAASPATSVSPPAKPADSGASPLVDRMMREKAKRDALQVASVASAAPKVSTPQKNALANVSDSSSSPTPAPAAPSVDPRITKLRQRALDLQGPNAQEQALQEQLSGIASQQANLSASEALGLQRIEDKPIALNFITGQQASLQRNAAAQQAALEAQQRPLLERLAAEQAQRTLAAQRAQSELDASKPTFQSVGGNLLRINPATGQVETVFSAPQDAASPVTLGAGETLVDPTTGRKIFSVPGGDSVEQFTLGKGQVRFDAQGNVIASGPQGLGGGAFEGANELLSVKEAEQLGVPFGTTKGQAALMGISPGRQQESAQVFEVQSLVDQILNNPNIDSFIGPVQGRLPATTKGRADFIADVERLKNLLTLENLDLMSGVLSESDIKILQGAATSLSAGTSEAKFKEELQRIRNSVSGGASQQQFSPEEIEYLRSQGADVSQLIFNQVGSDTNLGALKASIIQQESGGNYQAVGIPTSHGRALGKYQIIPKFHFQKIGLDPNSQADQQRFLQSPQLQDQLFGTIIDDLAARYQNNPAKIAAAYYGGDGGVQALGTQAANRRFQGGQSPSVNEYVNSVLSRIS